MRPNVRPWLHNEVLKCIHLALCNKYGLEILIPRSHSVQEVVINENVEIRIDTQIKTDIKIQQIRYIFIFEIEIVITNLDLLTQADKIE